MADLLCSSIEAFTPAFFHLDIDYRAARQPGSLRTLQADLVRVADCCRVSGIPFGIIIWGYEEDTAETLPPDGTASLWGLLRTVKGAL